MKSILPAVLAVAIIPASVQAAGPALEGHCPVCLVEMGQAVPGSDRHAVTYDRQAYYFPSDKEKQMFLANPARYAPALGGDCVVCRAHMGARMPGRVEFAAVHNGRAFLFPSAKERDAFRADPKKYESVDLALGGHCSVCLVMAKKWAPGKAEFTSVYDGMRYLFPSAEEKRAFEADPARFTPALDGDCVVCLKAGGKRMAGSLNYSATHEGRIYLFPSEMEQRQFLNSPETYAHVDVANSGQCVVCAKMANQAVAGSPEYTSVYKGQRYLFPSAKERAMFDADPAAFVRSDMKVGATPAKGIDVVGRTACAVCSYGVKPTTDADSLGIAVVTADAVHVVEGGETRYPELFDARFNGLTVELTGTVKKREGKFVWVEPTSLTPVPR